MGPELGEPGHEVAHLGQFHLKLRLSGPGAQGEDVQNEAAAVDDLLVQQLAQGPGLHGAQVHVEDDCLGLALVGQGLQLLDLSRPDEGAGVQPWPVLEHPAHHLGAGRVGQGGQFIQALLFLLTRGAGQHHAHDNGLFGRFFGCDRLRSGLLH